MIELKGKIDTLIVVVIGDFTTPTPIIDRTIGKMNKYIEHLKIIKP